MTADYYRSLFGRKGTTRGADIDMSEHGRVGGVSTGQPFKFTVPIDSTSGDVLTPTPAITGFATSANQTTGNTLLGGIAGFTPTVYDYISLTYTGDNLTGVVFKTGGSGGSTISTLTLAYTGAVLDSVTKT